MLVLLVDVDKILWNMDADGESRKAKFSHSKEYSVYIVMTIQSLK